VKTSPRQGPILLHDAGATDGKGSNHRIGPIPRIGAGPAPANACHSDLLPRELLPPLPAFVRNGSHSSAEYSDDSTETFPARLCHLCGSRAVFVAVDEGATSLIIDTSEMGRSAVRRVPAEELAPGQYLLIRTAGGGDFIAPLADRILGAAAARRRSEQAEWKSRLVSQATQLFGSISRRELAFQVCSTLRARGSSQPRPENVHYWMSSKCIRPRKEEDFAAILAFAGMEARSRELWAAMGDISRAHARAGQLIRRMLLQRISETSLEPLERDGEMIFDLGDHEGGTLSAFEIIGIQEEEFEIPTERIGVLLDGEA
jgi:hypothetical protein